MTQGAGRAGNGRIDRLAVLAAVRDADVADTLAGHGQNLGIGIADNGIGIDGRNIGGVQPVIGQLPVGLVGEDVDGMADLLALAGEQLGQLLQGLHAVDDAGGVVGRVDDQRLGVGGDALFQLVKANLEMLGIGRNHHALEAGGGRVGGILGEVGGDQQNLRVLHSQGVHARGHSGGSAAGEEDVLRANRRAGALAQIGGDGLPGLGTAAGGGVAVQGNGIGSQQLPHGVSHSLGGGDGGIADGEIKDVFLAHLGGLLHAVLKQDTNAALGNAHLVVFFYDHLEFLPFR